MANPAAAPDRQRLRLLLAPHQRGRGDRDPARQPRRRADGRAADASLHDRPTAQGVGPQRRRDRPVVGLHRAAGIDQHPSDPDGGRTGCWNCFRRAQINDATRDELQRRAPRSRWSGSATSSSFTITPTGAPESRSGTSFGRWRFPKRCSTDRAVPDDRRRLPEPRRTVRPARLGPGDDRPEHHARTLASARRPARRRSSCGDFLEMTRAGLCPGGVANCPTMPPMCRDLRRWRVRSSCRSECVKTRLSLLLAGIASLTSAAAEAQSYRARLPEDEVIYFLLPDRFENGDPSNDRGGLTGDRLATGFDPTHKGFYHGGDLKGLTKRLDYIQGLGATAVWLSPIFKNKPVQGPPGPGKRRLSRLLDHRLHPRRPASRHQRRLQGLRRCGARAGHEGLHGHHRQPHGGRHLSGGMRGQGRMPLSQHRRLSVSAARRASAERRSIAGFDGAANFARLTDPNYAYTVTVPAGRAGT